MSTDYLAYLEREAAARVAARRARRVKMPPCRMCGGSGSVTRYVLPGITGPDKCKSCNGTGDAPAPPAADQGPAIQVHCSECGAVPGNRCRNKRYSSPVPLPFDWYFVRPHAARKATARELANFDRVELRGLFHRTDLLAMESPIAFGKSWAPGELVRAIVQRREAGA